jgi:hypothetical protein
MRKMSDPPGNSKPANKQDWPLSPEPLSLSSPAPDDDLRFPELELEPLDAVPRQQPEDVPAAAVTLMGHPGQKEQAMRLIASMHAHIAQAIDATWGTRECVQYMQRLMADSFDRNSKVRAGFKVEVSDALMALLAMHPEPPPEPPRRSSGKPWSTP